MSDLVEQLRRQGEGNDGYRTVFNGTLLEAATALEAKDKEIEALRASYDRAVESRLEWRHRAETAERKLAEEIGEPTTAMIDAGVAFALNVSLSGEYRWSQYVADLYKTMRRAARAVIEQKE